MATMIQPDDVDINAVVIASIDDFLRVIHTVRDEKPRDPMRRLEDVLLDMRNGVRPA